jgi:tetratricopeptide (TPR) repeat protein
MSSSGTHERAQALTNDAAFDFAVGDEAGALTKLNEAVALAPDFFEAWLAKAEVHFAQRQFDDALQAGEKALNLKPKDIHIHTSLSRIWMERGDKTKAEHHGAQARFWAGVIRLNSPRAGRLAISSRHCDSRDFLCDTLSRRVVTD